jgi:hypothetical protein
MCTIENVSGQHHALTTLVPGKEPQFLFNRRLAVPQSRSGHFEEEKIFCRLWDSNLRHSIL